MFLIRFNTYSLFSHCMLNHKHAFLFRQQLVSLAEGPQTLPGARLNQSEAVKDETEDVPLESGAAAIANNMVDEKDTGEQQTKS